MSNQQPAKAAPQENSPTRGGIIQAASKLFLKKSFDQTSIRDIANACGMAMGTLYHHIGSKENLLSLVVARHAEKTGEVLERFRSIEKRLAPADALAASLNLFIETIDKNKAVFVFVFTEAKVMPAHNRKMLLDTQRRIVNAFERIIERGRQEGAFFTDNTRLSAHCLVSLVEMWGVKWWYLKDFYTLESYKAFITGFILNSISCISTESDISPNH